MTTACDAPAQSVPQVVFACVRNGGRSVRPLRSRRAPHAAAGSL